jgi:hypothetical protein
VALGVVAVSWVVLQYGEDRSGVVLEGQGMLCRVTLCVTWVLRLVMEVSFFNSGIFCTASWMTVSSTYLYRAFSSVSRLCCCIPLKTTQR